MSKKIYFITTEISPFAEVSNLASFSANVPLALQDMGNEVRTIIPKYGFISERKYILREVIRLKSIPFEFNGENIVASAKSGFIPKTRVQVYFLESEAWFKNLTNLLYKAKNGRVMLDNGKRYSFYSKAVLSTLPHLFWSPDIFICNGWQSALIPSIYKQQFEGLNEFYKGLKTLLVIHELDEYAQFEREVLKNIGISIDKTIKGDNINIFEVASFDADKIVILDKPSSLISKKLMALGSFKKNKEKVTIVKTENDEDFNFNSMSEQINNIISKL